MTWPKVLLREDIDRIFVGMTNIYIQKTDHSVLITHAGNPEDTIDTVKRNVDRALGIGSWDNLRSVATNVEEDGNPDYLFTVTFNFM